MCFTSIVQKQPDFSSSAWTFFWDCIYWIIMCRWGCTTNDTTHMCKWCGTRYCSECLRGDFPGLMVESTKCRVCNQIRCKGVRVEYVPRQVVPAADASKKKGRGTSAARGKSASKRRSAKKSGRKRRR